MFMVLLLTRCYYKIGFYVFFILFLLEMMYKKGIGIKIPENRVFVPERT